MTQTLYNACSHIDAHGNNAYQITKFVDGEVESSYLTTRHTCDCPAGQRPSCRHRQMLPHFLNANIVNTHWFWNFERQCVADFQGYDPIPPDLSPETKLALSTPAFEFDTLPEGITQVSLNSPTVLHNAIAEAVGEPEIRVGPPESSHDLAIDLMAKDITPQPHRSEVRTGAFDAPDGGSNPSAAAKPPASWRRF